MDYIEKINKKNKKIITVERKRVIIKIIINCYNLFIIIIDFYFVL